MLRFNALRVAEVRSDADDAVAVSLDLPVHLQDLYRGLPGQHVVLRAQIDGEEVRRTYSLVNCPGESVLRIAVRVHREGRMSRYLAEKVRVGESIDVMPPNGSFTPRQTASSPKTFVAFAAGCGITPVLSVARSLLRANPHQRVIVFYGNTATHRVMCLEELLALKNMCMGRLSLHFVMSREPQEIELYNGRLDGEKAQRIVRSFLDPAGVSEWFVCGPGKMNHDLGAALRSLGVSSERIHVEHFHVTSGIASPEAKTVPGSEPQPPPGSEPTPGTEPALGSEPAQPRAQVIGRSAEERSAVPDADTAEPTVRFSAKASPEMDAVAVNRTAAETSMSEVTVIMDGRRRSFTMRMNDETVLDASARAGLDLPFSCRAGVCSTCRTKVVRGEVEMAQNYALDEAELEEGYILACQSRVKTPVLELDYDEK